MTVESQMKGLLESARQQCEVHGVEWSSAVEAVLRNTVGGVLMNLSAAEGELIDARRELQALKRAQARRCGACKGTGQRDDTKYPCDWCGGSGER